jgi:hypothetical protein
MFRKISIGATCAAFSSTLVNFHAESPLLPLFEMEPSGKARFPRKIKVENETRDLFAVGVRQVTFLSVNAYSLGLYGQLCALKNSRWKQEYLPSKWSKTSSESSFYLSDLLRIPLTIAINPVRATDGTHLRNGWIRLLSKRFQKESPSMSVLEREKFQDSLQKFRGAFPSGVFPSGSMILFSTLADGRMICELEGREAQPLGFVENEHLIRWFFEAYLLDESISPTFVSSIGQRLGSFFRDK